MKLLELHTTVQASILQFLDLKELHLLFKLVSKKTSHCMKQLNQQFNYKFQYLIPCMPIHCELPPGLSYLRIYNTMISKPSKKESSIQQYLHNELKCKNLYQESPVMHFRQATLQQCCAFTISFSFWPDLPDTSQNDSTRHIHVIVRDMVEQDPIRVVTPYSDQANTCIEVKQQYWNESTQKQKEQLFLSVLEFAYNNGIFQNQIVIPEQWKTLFHHQSTSRNNSIIYDQYLEFVTHMLTCKDKKDNYIVSEKRFYSIVPLPSNIKKEKPLDYSYNRIKSNEYPYLSGSYHPHANNIYFAVYEQLDMFHQTNTHLKQTLLDRYIHASLDVNRGYLHSIAHYINDIPTKYRKYISDYRDPYWTVNNGVLAYHCYSFRKTQDGTRLFIKKLTWSFPGKLSAEHFYVDRYKTSSRTSCCCYLCYGGICCIGSAVVCCPLLSLGVFFGRQDCDNYLFGIIQTLTCNFGYDTLHCISRVCNKYRQRDSFDEF
jgi:hypothetical protein